MTPSRAMWIAHISDPHVRPAGVLYKGVVDANARLATAVFQINRLQPRPDLVVLTGDVVDEGDPAEYAAARAILAGLLPRLLVIPGNHDERDTFRAAFADRASLTRSGPLHLLDASGAVRIIGLDVTVPGRHHGEIDDARLEWLAAALGDDPSRPAIVLMHQPSIECGVPYLDRYRCMDDGRLERLIHFYPAVERILCGHLHRHITVRFGGTLLCTAPSTATAIALRPYPDAQPASFLEPPGFLLHHWDGTTMLTHTIPLGEFAGPFPFA